MAVAIYIRLRAGSAHSFLCTYIHSRNLSVISCRQTFGQGHTDCDARMAQQAARRIVRNSEMGSDIEPYRGGVQLHQPDFQPCKAWRPR